MIQLPKIKNWDRVKDVGKGKRRQTVWKNTENRGKVRIIYLQANESNSTFGSGPAWVLDIKNSKGRTSMAGGKYDSYRAAKKDGVEWMRNHPKA